MCDLISNSKLMRIVKRCVFPPSISGGNGICAESRRPGYRGSFEAFASRSQPAAAHDQIGGRVPGTVAMRQAVDWGVAAFKAAGADSVHTENFTIQASWAESFTRMSIAAPEQFDVRAISLAGRPALPARGRMCRSSTSDTGSLRTLTKLATLPGHCCSCTPMKCPSGTTCSRSISGRRALLIGQCKGKAA